jgi:hypothetical protein
MKKENPTLKETLQQLLALSQQPTWTLTCSSKIAQEDLMSLQQDVTSIEATSGHQQILISQVPYVAKDGLYFYATTDTAEQSTLVAEDPIDVQCGYSLPELSEGPGSPSPVSHHIYQNQRRLHHAMKHQPKEDV